MSTPAPRIVEVNRPSWTSAALDAWAELFLHWFASCGDGVTVVVDCTDCRLSRRVTVAPHLAPAGEPVTVG